MRRLIALAVLISACGGSDSTGPSNTNFTGTYNGNGRYYVIATSTIPQERDSLDGGPATITLTRGTGEAYELSIVMQAGGASGASGGVTINSAGVFSFPNFDEAAVINGLSSALLGICNFANASASPSGVVQNSRATVKIQASGLICDFGAGTGTPDLRPTIAQFTWTGTN